MRLPVAFLAIVSIYGICEALECKCNKEEVTCELSSGSQEVAIPDCPGAELVRSMGDGYVLGVKTPVPAPMSRVFLHKTTLDCGRVMNIFSSTGVTLKRYTPLTTLTTATLRTPKGRPPVVPVDDDDGNNNDDDGDDDDDNDDDQITSTSTETTNSTNSTTITTTENCTSSTTSTTTVERLSAIVIRGHVNLAWGLGITFVVVIGAGFIVLVVRLRRRRRRTERLIQLAEVSSSTPSTLSECSRFRSPRRRRASVSSMESVSLFSVNEHQD